MAQRSPPESKTPSPVSQRDAPPSGFLSQPLRMGESRRAGRGEGSASTPSTTLEPAEAHDDTPADLQVIPDVPWQAARTRTGICEN